MSYDEKAPRFKNWETPRDFFDKLNAEFHFTYDVAASHDNHLCEYYFTEKGEWRKQPGHSQATPITYLVDGLSASWIEKRVFCNPPYDASVSKWVDKAFLFEAEVAVLLLPPNFDTAWGQRIWEEYLQSWVRIAGGVKGMNVEIRLPPGRLRFWRPAFAQIPLDRQRVLGRWPKGGYQLKDYEFWGEEIFDYSKPHVPGESPRAGNLIAVFRK